MQTHLWYNEDAALVYGPLQGLMLIVQHNGREPSFGIAQRNAVFLAARRKVAGSTLTVCMATCGVA